MSLVSVIALLVGTTLANDSHSTFDVLASRADAAVHVRVLAQSSRFEGGRIVTDSHCQVLDAAFGAAAGSDVTVTTLGGYVGSIGQTVFGLERPMPGDELALLLGPDGYMNGGRNLVGFSLGMFRVVSADSQPANDAPLLGYALDSSRAARETATPPVTLGEFLARAKQAHGN